LSSTLILALRRNLTAGVLAGLCGALVFALAHAMIIVPIWSRSGSGFVLGALAGLVAGWAYGELGFDPTRNPARSLSVHLASGGAFGALLWLAVVPVSLVDALLRVLGIAPRYELGAVGVAVILALTGGALLGWGLMRTRRASLAGASATLLLTIAMAGPVPIGRSLRALGIFLAVLPAAVVGGVILAGLTRVLVGVGVAPAPQDSVTPRDRGSSLSDYVH
jgi:hypothetical protein